MDMLKRVDQTIRRHSMLRRGDRVLVGLSGGPDSVCLLHLLNELRGGWDLDLRALYVDHGLRPEEARREKEFCAALTEGLGIPFSVREVDVKGHAEREGLSIQDAARQLRYRAFEEEAALEEAARIATGHTADDQAETVLIWLLRGAGPKGLSGMQPVRGRIIRPLIEVQRKEVMEYLDSRGIRYVIDTSNLKLDYLRNRLRQELMPLLRRYNPGIVETLCRTAEILREENEYMERIVTKALMRLISRKTDEGVELFLSPMEGMERVILRRVLIRAVEATRGLRGLGFRHIEEIVSLVRSGSTGSRIHLPGGVRAVRGYATLTITSAPVQRLGEYTLEVPGETVLKEAGVVIVSSITEEAPGEVDGKTEAVFDLDRLNLPLRVRSRRPGDFFYPSGLGRRKKLQDYFVDEKVPRDVRDTVPLVLSGEDIIWVVGYRTDDRYRPGPSTGRVLRMAVRTVR